MLIIHLVFTKNTFKCVVLPNERFKNFENVLLVGRGNAKYMVFLNTFVITLELRPSE